MKPANLFAEIPAKVEQEIFSELVKSENVSIQRIVSRGQASPETGWYDQDDHEWVVVLEGEGELTYESGDVVRLVAGSYVNIPAHTRHRVSWTAPDKKTIWLAIHYR